MLVVTGSRNAEERVSVTASADKLIANKILDAVRTMLRKDGEAQSFEKAYTCRKKSLEKVLS